MLVVRHAYSMFNAENSDYRESEDKSNEAFMKVWAGDHLVDALLHPIGEQQAAEQQQLMNYFRFRKVFMSPQRRAIQTAALMLQSHPCKAEIVFTLVPLAKENLHTSGDVCLSYKDTVKFAETITQKFGFEFDFSLFAPYEAQGIDTWQYQILTNTKKREHLIKES